MSRSTRAKLRARSALIDADLRAMEASTDVFVYTRDGLLDQAGTVWPLRPDKFGRTVHVIQIDPFNVRRFRTPYVQKLGDMSEETAGGHGLGTCGVRKENRWRKEQGLPKREFRGPVPPKQ